MLPLPAGRLLFANKQTEDECTDPELGCRLLDYELGELTVRESLEFEAHLLACDVCFEDLRSIAAAHDVFRVLLSIPESPDLVD